MSRAGDTNTTAQLEQRLGYRFERRELLRQALRHPSYAHEQDERLPDYERLEFVGDAVLELAVTRELFDRFCEVPEGSLSRMRARLVSGKNLASVAARIGLEGHILLGRGEQRSGGARRRSILANALEALLGAIYLEAGFPRARDVALALLREDIERLEVDDAHGDFKSRLQELTQAESGERPGYRIVERFGPDHAATFVAEVELPGGDTYRGEGRSKRDAQQKAAAAALKSREDSS